MPATARTILAGLIGAGIHASRTPAMHEREGAALGMDYTYRFIDLDVIGVGPEALPELLAQAERDGYAGLNITYPCKQAVIQHLTELSDDARALGAVNTVVLRDGKRIGHNTDWSGFFQSFKRGLPGASLEKVVQLGAGGGGSATAYAALKLGANNLAVFDVDIQRARMLATQLNEVFGSERVSVASQLELAMLDADGLIHATPTGMTKHPGMPLSAELLRSEMWVAEIVYFPLETELLKMAKQLGCCMLDGSGMAIYQAADAFQLITGNTPDPERMRRQFDSI